MLKRLICFAISFFMLFALCGCESMQRLSEDEAWAVNNCKELYTTLKDPDSLRIYSDAIIIKKFKEGSQQIEGRYMLLDYGAKNGYGGMERETCIFDDVHGYLGEYHDAKNHDSDLLIRAHASAEVNFYVGLIKTEDNDKNDEYEKIIISRELLEKQLGLNK